jgi:hypothetical protein
MIYNKIRHHNYNLNKVPKITEDGPVLRNPLISTGFHLVGSRTLVTFVFSIMRLHVILKKKANIVLHSWPTFVIQVEATQIM